MDYVILIVVLARSWGMKFFQKIFIPYFYPKIS